MNRIDHDLDLLADHDEIELAEVGDDAGGAFPWTTVTILTILTGGACPTTSCTKSCNTLSSDTGTGGGSGW